AVIQIAREMSMTAGEVELILSLERNRRLPAELSGFSQRPAQPEQAEQAEQLKAPFSEQAPRGARLDEQA
ncbi:MAG: hypothetical protein HQ546_08590, partial [Planctomycetes bacterium]|nr:hypothetical protein [Planctomycetota bacterium]